MNGEAIDAVYMWVDDSFPGYLESRNRYAAIPQDLSANRTRDNLETLKYSLRALRRHAPWIGHIYIVACAPQRPRWLADEMPGLSVIPHDKIMDAGDLPTFNSFAIQSCLHRIPGLSRRFLQFDDDVLLSAPVTPASFADGAGRLRVFQRFGHTPGAQMRAAAAQSSWNAALAQCNFLLDSAFGKAKRPTFTHAPLLIDRDWWAEMIGHWPEHFAHTRSSRFRATGNIVPDYLYPHFLLATGRASRVSHWATYRETFYYPLEDYVAYLRWKMLQFKCLQPRTLCLNDNFGEQPNGRAVAYIRRFLDAAYPVKSAFER